MSDQRPVPGSPAAEPEDPEQAAETAAALADQRRQERRRFLRHASVLGAASVGASYVSLAPPGWPGSLRDPDGERGKPQVPFLRLPEGGYAVRPSPTLPHLGVARGKNVPAMVRAAVDAIGGIGRFVSRGDVVVIKPNVAFERPAVLGATTHPEVLSALIHLVREAGAAEIRVADNPIESPQSCFVRTGIQQAAIAAGARVFLPSAGEFQTVNVPGATWIEKWPFFYRPFHGANKVIGVAPVKDHNLCRASMTTKNWYGLLGGRRNQFHQDIHGIIADLALMLRPTFVLLDGSRVLFRSGPTGGSLSDVKAAHTMVASTDSLAADAFGWDNLLERKGEALPAYFARSTARKLGNPDWRNLHVKEVQAG
jgi:uncharacterized protein (DUF362 family)